MLGLRSTDENYGSRTRQQWQASAADAACKTGGRSGRRSPGSCAIDFPGFTGIFQEAFSVWTHQSNHRAFLPSFRLAFPCHVTIRDVGTKHVSRYHPERSCIVAPVTVFCSSRLAVISSITDACVYISPANMWLIIRPPLLWQFVFPLRSACSVHFGCLLGKTPLSVYVCKKKTSQLYGDI